jgi:predicted ribosome quality control (RQC) complex YloA/Tae2 family protein
VDYTERRHVRKPAGARPGFVLYKNFQTLTITPDPELLKRLGIEVDRSE